MDSNTTKIIQNAFNIPGLIYIRNFITEEEESYLSKNINNQSWMNSLSRRVQHYGYEYDYKSKTAKNNKVDDIPEFINFIIDRLLSLKLYKEKPDQLIINEYESSQGIFPHIDATNSFKDVISSLSLLSDIGMEFILYNNKKTIMLERRSLVVLTGDARYKWRHGIEKRLIDKNIISLEDDGITEKIVPILKRNLRISLTFRNMIK